MTNAKQIKEEWGHQNESEHPFTSWTFENDCRTTTKYIENNVASAILSYCRLHLQTDLLKGKG